MRFSTILKAAVDNGTARYEDYDDLALFLVTDDSQKLKYPSNRTFINPFIYYKGERPEPSTNFYLTTSADSGLVRITFDKPEIQKKPEKNDRIVQNVLNLFATEEEEEGDLPSNLLEEWCDYKYLLMTMYNLGICPNPKQMEKFYERYFNTKHFGNLVKEIGGQVGAELQVGSVRCKKSLFIALLNRGGIYSITRVGLNVNDSLTVEMKKTYQTYIFQREPEYRPKISSYEAEKSLRGGILIEDNRVLTSTVDSAMRSWWEFVIAAATYSGINEIIVNELKSRFDYSIHIDDMIDGYKIQIEETDWKKLEKFVESDVKNKSFVTSMNCEIYRAAEEKSGVIERLEEKGIAPSVELHLYAADTYKHSEWIPSERVDVFVRYAQCKCRISESSVSVKVFNPYGQKMVSTAEFEKALKMIRENRFPEVHVRDFNTNVLADILIEGAEPKAETVEADNMSAHEYLLQLVRLREDGVDVYVRREGRDRSGDFWYDIYLHPEGTRPGNFVLGLTDDFKGKPLKYKFTVLESSESENNPPLTN